jgi:NAD(P)H-hydrate epimerase
VDRRCTEEYGIPSVVLMENAAIGLAQVVRRAARAAAGGAGRGVLVVCGRGNNGGDGLAASRHLANAGVPVAIVLGPGGSLAADAAVHLRVARAMGLVVVEAGEVDAGVSLESAAARLGGEPAVVVDALLGTGVDRPVRGSAAAMIAAVNAMAVRTGAMVVSADLPSGMDADSGRGLAENPSARDAAVRADVTVTFVGPKRGFLSLEAQPFLGEVVVRGIGAPAALVEAIGQRLPRGWHPGSGRRPGGARRAAGRPGRRS